MRFCMPASVAPKQVRGGKSGQHRAPYFLTGRRQLGDRLPTDSATESKPPRLAGVRVKAQGKSLRPAPATAQVVNLMG